jgi:hypothetical protein
MLHFRRLCDLGALGGIIFDEWRAEMPTDH